MRDMVPPERRSIRNIPVSSRRRSEAPSQDEIAEEVAMQERPPMIRRRSRGGGKRLFYIIAGIVVILCAVGGLLLSTLFAGATVTVYPKEEQVTPPATLTAGLNPPAGSLGYAVITVTRSATTTVPASGTKQVSRSASGPITVYNATNASQRLIANTRFQAPNGKIYRIHDSVIVPAEVNASTPGSASAIVYADSPGAEYNIASDTRFTIPGFKSDPRYNQFYAQGSAISGGYIGPEPAIADADLTKASDDLKASLSQAAQSSLASQIPSNYMAIPGTLQVTFSDITQTPGQDNTATISQSATMSGGIIPTGDLAAAIAKQTVTGYNGEAVGFLDASQISISSATSTAPSGTITIAISGTPTLVWQYDPAAIKAAVIGKPKSQFQSIIQSFAPAVARAEAKVRPFWESTFPSDPRKVQVVTGAGSTQ
ncbi:MAG TPA: hypothetical protein VG753_03400 [Candidatus Paceibacterota bacterium]|nr:hypothetical protein [Candidatus Paceibacterota bacterium]